MSKTEVAMDSESKEEKTDDKADEAKKEKIEKGALEAKKVEAVRKISE
jgi:hypothetical protein